MGTDQTPTTRRALLTGGLGALAAFAVQAIGLPRQARAANGDPLLLGQSNGSSATTSLVLLDRTPDNGPLLRLTAGSGAQNGDPDYGDGLVVWARNRAIQASTGGGTAIRGTSTDQVGDGYSTGVHGEGRVGVHGEGPTGVRGISASGDGGYFKSTTGNGLSVDGRVRFNRSGQLQVPAGSSRVTKTIQLSTTSFILATMQQRRPGIYIEAVVPDAANERFTIYLNKPVSASTRIGWFVIR